MAIDTRIVGAGKFDQTIREAHIHAKDGHVGILALTQPFLEFDPIVLPFLSSTGSLEMAVDARFSGTPEGVHNGGDSTLWTPTTVAGTWDFGATTHAHEGIITILTFGSLSGATMQVDGTNITNTTRTEGVDWTAETSNTVTATNLTAVLTNIAGISATSVANVITVVADPLSDITTFTESDPTNMPATAQSIDGTSTIDAAQALFTDSGAGSIALGSFVGISGQVYLTTFNEARNELLLQFRLGGVTVGDAIDLTDFVNPALLDEWQSFVILKESLGVTGETVDELTLTVVVTAGVAPNFFLDRMQVEASGGAVFTATPNLGTRFFLATFDLIMADALAGTVANGTMLGLSYDKLLGVSKLTAGGIVLTRFSEGKIAFRTSFSDLSEMLFGGLDILDSMSDGTNTMLKLRNTLPIPVALNEKVGDRIEITFAEDLSGLLTFKGLIRGNELLTRV